MQGPPSLPEANFAWPPGVSAPFMGLELAAGASAGWGKSLPSPWQGRAPAPPAPPSPGEPPPGPPHAEGEGAGGAEHRACQPLPSAPAPSLTARRCVAGRDPAAQEQAREGGEGAQRAAAQQRPPGEQGRSQPAPGGLSASPNPGACPPPPPPPPRPRCPQITELTSELTDERNTGESASQLLDAETAERLRAEKEMKDLQVTHRASARPPWHLPGSPRGSPGPCPLAGQVRCPEEADGVHGDGGDGSSAHPGSRAQRRAGRR